MHVYTKTGDAGETGLYTGERVKKSSLRVDVYGTIDEADAAFGMARAFATKAEVKTAILGIQKKLSSLMADIASLDKGPIIHEEDVIALESAMDDIEERLPKLTSFLIPGGSPAGACLDHARTVVRRAERRGNNGRRVEAENGTGEIAVLSFCEESELAVGGIRTENEFGDRSEGSAEGIPVLAFFSDVRKEGLFYFDEGRIQVPGRFG